MSWFLSFLACILLLTQASARIADIEEGRAISPDGKFKIIVEESRRWKTDQGSIVYKLINCRTRRTLIVLRCSYGVPDLDYRNEWDSALGATIFWNKQSSFAAIDERSLAYRGQIHLVAILSSDHAKLLELPEEKICIKTGFEWEKVRVRVCYPEPEGGWIDERRLCLTLGGYPANKIGEPRSVKGYPNMRFKAVIEVTPNLRIRIMSVGPEAAGESAKSAEASVTLA